MRLRSIMNDRVWTVTEDILAEEAWHLMNLYEIHHLVVLRGKEVVGILSERDLGGKRGEKICEGHIVSDLMSTGIVSAHPDMLLRDAANLMRGHGIGCLPVI